MINTIKKDYEIGDEAWIYMVPHKGELTKSKVVHKFKLEYGPEYYVCEVATPIDPLLEVRDWWSMAPSADAKIGLNALCGLGNKG